MATLVIAGLGNPGAQYAQTRHNLGYEVLDLLAKRLGSSFRVRVRGHQATAQAGEHRVVLIKPTTFMNLSGQAVAPLLRRNGLPPSNLLVIHDDLDLPAGRVRVRRGGSAGGHRGVQSIIEALGTPEFSRLKIGIGRPPTGVDPVDFVLMRPQPNERAQLGAGIDLAVQACEVWLIDGIAAAMNAVNGSDPSGGPGNATPGGRA
jgi:PTH1 family peptidyl-tRNA hydrolase